MAIRCKGGAQREGVPHARGKTTFIVDTDSVAYQCLGQDGSETREMRLLPCTMQDQKEH